MMSSKQPGRSTGESILIRPQGHIFREEAPCPRYCKDLAECNYTTYKSSLTVHLGSFVGERGGDKTRSKKKRIGLLLAAPCAFDPPKRPARFFQLNVARPNGGVNDVNDTPTTILQEHEL